MTWPLDSKTDEATWNYYEGIAVANERAAQLLRKEAEGLGEETDPALSLTDEKAKEIRGLVEHGTSPEAEAARVLRKFMCCQAGRELVEYGLLRPFRLTTAALPPESQEGER